MLLLTLLCASALAASLSDVLYFSALQDGTVQRLRDEKALAWAKVHNRSTEQGYEYLIIESSASASNEEQVDAAAAVEGYATAGRISQYYHNFMADLWPDGVPSELSQYIKANMQYMIDQSSAHADEPFWDAVGLVVNSWLPGLLRGYQQARSESLHLLASQRTEGELQDLTLDDVFLMQMLGDWDDLEAVIMPPEVSAASREKRISKGQHHHCTGLVRVNEDLSDCYLFQDTWTSFASGLLRVMKHQHLHLKLGNVTEQRISYSSYPGVFFSLDDFYIQSNTYTDQGLTKTSNLGVIETTFHTFNTSLYDEFCRKDGNSVLTWVRSQVSNWLATSPDTWVEAFSNDPSYTYNNQWHIVDYQLFEELNSQLCPGCSKSEKIDYIRTNSIQLLRILEVVPGHPKAWDATERLLIDADTRSKDVDKDEGAGFSMSINTPSDEELFIVSGYAEKNDPYWSYNQSSRYNIIKRDVPSIKTFDQFKEFARYNDYQNDPASNGDPGQSICSRYDLRNETAIGRAPSTFGCTDTKATDRRLARSLAFDVFVGPTRGVNGDFPEWNFSDYPEVVHEGIPDTMPCVWSLFLPQVNWK